jgi:integrase
MPRVKVSAARRRVRGEGTLYEKTRTWKTSDGKTHSKKMWVAAISEGCVAEFGRQRRRRRFFYGGTAAEALHATGCRRSKRSHNARPSASCASLRGTDWRAQEIGGVVTFVEPKTALGRRRITLSAIAVKGLERRKAIAKREGIADLIFPDESGRLLRKDAFAYRDWGPIRKAAGLPDLNFHRLRHTAASLLLIEGGPYLIPTMQAGAADAFDRVFGPGGKRAQKGT